MIPEKLLVKIRYCVDRDLKSLEHIDSAEKFGWEASDFKKFRKPENNIALVADYEDTPVAYAMLSVTDKRVKIEKMGVTLVLRRRSIGSQLIDRIKYGFLRKNRTAILAEIDEYNLVAQLFFRQNEFRCNEIVGEYGNIMYIMEYFK